jgi:hypothetical protein
MTHTFEIDVKKGILRESFKGLITHDVLNNANIAITSNPEFERD